MVKADWAKEFATGETNVAIARRLDCAETTVLNNRRKLGLAPITRDASSTHDRAIVAHARARMVRNALHGHALVNECANG